MSRQLSRPDHCIHQCYIDISRAAPCCPRHSGAEIELRWSHRCDGLYSTLLRVAERMRRAKVVFFLVYSTTVGPSTARIYKANHCSVMIAAGNRRTRAQSFLKGWRNRKSWRSVWILKLTKCAACSYGQQQGASPRCQLYQSWD